MGPAPVDHQRLGSVGTAFDQRLSVTPIRQAVPVAWVRWLGWLTVALAISAYAALAGQRASLEVRVNYDPTLQYLFASLAALKGWEYRYVDHPGTPIELLGSLILLAMRQVSGLDGEAFILAIVREPEQFLHVADVLLWIGTLGVVAAMIRWLLPGKRFQEAAFAVACGGAYFAIHPLSFSVLSIWSHNSFNLIAGTSVWLVLLVRLRRRRPLRSWQVLAFGFAAGALTSIQLYFAAWIVGIALTLIVYAVLLGGSKVLALLIGITSLIGGTLGFLVCTLPIRNEYLVFGQFVVSLVTHQGVYGAGPEGIPSSALLLDNVRQLITQAPLVFVSMILVFTLLGYRLSRAHWQPEADPGRSATCFGLSVQVLLLVSLIVKHPGAVYLLSVAATIPVLAGCALASLNLGQRLRTSLPATTMTAVLIGVVWNYQQSTQTLFSFEQRVDQARVAVDSALLQIAAAKGKRPDELQVAWTYGTNDGCFARWFADTGGLSSEIASGCPDQLSLDVFRHLISSPSGNQRLERAIDGTP